MMKRICPVCDQVMKHAHYCSACRSWVKEPVLMNVTYYLNERHPKNEANCTYHNDHTEPERRTGMQKTASWELDKISGRVKGKPADKNYGRTAGNTVGRYAGKLNGNESRKAAQSQTKQTGKKTNPVKKLMILYVVLVILVWLIRIVG